ncbi:MAG: acyltransferase [Candidatus Izemoplasmatales bacterium]
MNNVFVGSGSIILSDVRIGPNAIIAAGSVVTHDVPPNSVVGGIPARVICTFDEYFKKHCEQAYPNELKPYKQTVDEKVISYMWDAFFEQRDNSDNK